MANFTVTRLPDGRHVAKSDETCPVGFIRVKDTYAQAAEAARAVVRDHLKFVARVK
jgi:hypothetical protein